MSLWEAMAHPLESGLNVTKGTYQKLQEFMNMMTAFMQQLPMTNAYDLGKDIISQSGMMADLMRGSDPDDLSRQQNLEEFMNGLQEFVDTRREEGRAQEALLPDFLQEVSLLTDLDSDEGNESKVVLMTVHAAKGLEFPTVFIVGLEENIFPSPLSTNSLRELEEERRLLYVAITRAEKHCILTCAKNRWRYGKMEFDVPSRFLKDIDPSLLMVEGERNEAPAYDRMPSWRMQNSRPVASQFMADRQPKITAPRRPEPAVDPFSDRFKSQLAASGGNLRRINDAIRSGGRAMPSAASTAASASQDAPLREGNVIEHQRFGIGTVVKVEGTGENTKATVDFRNVGTKQLLLKFARYKLVK